MLAFPTRLVQSCLACAAGDVRTGRGWPNFAGVSSCERRLSIHPAMVRTASTRPALALIGWRTCSLDAVRTRARSSCGIETARSNWQGPENRRHPPGLAFEIVEHVFVAAPQTPAGNTASLMVTSDPHNRQ